MLYQSMDISLWFILINKDGMIVLMEKRLQVNIKYGWLATGKIIITHQHVGHMVTDLLISDGIMICGSMV